MLMKEAAKMQKETNILSGDVSANTVECTAAEKIVRHGPQPRSDSCDSYPSWMPLLLKRTPPNVRTLSSRHGELYR